ncbi:protein C21orf2 homolog isoform X2 [Pogonomyrmex barbatus]|uniref:Protein C21orf2 homolog isoform X2 n=1 Tax=Pogonomyrmex barbatus TaxID=144034 RepID=A0A6I9W1L0_9HYME|nr:protein C21orf2 homolog isoform X2 [Pogonomyrmex barbatus]
MIFYFLFFDIILIIGINNINTLADFQYCPKLRELFIRRNNIKDLNEVCYLQDLPNLRNLWLDENPCAEKEGYRLAVLRALPNLEKLDDKIVSPEEVQIAMAIGRPLIHPLEIDTSPQSDIVSPEDYDERSVIQQHNGDYDERRAYSEYSGNEVSQRMYTPTPSQRTQYAVNECADDKRNDRNNYNYDERTRLEYEESPQPPQIRRMAVHHNEREDISQVGWIRHSEKDKCRNQFHYHRRPVTRNSNILSAVLCLVKELDYPSLEVVEMAVRNRMDELEE